MRIRQSRRGLIFSVLILLISCSIPDMKSISLRNGRSDFYYSPTQYKLNGISGKCQVWDRVGKKYKIFPFTYKVTERVDWEYYSCDDLIYLGRGYEVFQDSLKIIKPGHDEFR